MKSKIFKIIRIIFILLGILTVIFIASVYFTASKMETKMYGKCGIEYSTSDFADTDLDRVANGLTKEGLFGPDKATLVMLEKEDSSFKIIFRVKSSIINNSEYQAFRDRLQTYFPENRVIIALTLDDDYIRTFKEFK